MDLKFQTLSEEEIMDIDGGIAWAGVIILGVGLVCLCVGAYNGYCDAAK